MAKIDEAPRRGGSTIDNSADVPTERKFLEKEDSIPLDALALIGVSAVLFGAGSQIDTEQNSKGGVRSLIKARSALSLGQGRPRPDFPVDSVFNNFPVTPISGTHQTIDAADQDDTERHCSIDLAKLSSTDCQALAQSIVLAEDPQTRTEIQTELRRKLIETQHQIKMMHQQARQGDEDFQKESQQKREVVSALQGVLSEVTYANSPARDLDLKATSLGFALSELSNAYRNS